MKIHPLRSLSLLCSATTVLWFCQNAVALSPAGPPAPGAESSAGLSGSQQPLQQAANSIESEKLQLIKKLYAVSGADEEFRRLSASILEHIKTSIYETLMIGLTKDPKLSDAERKEQAKEMTDLVYSMYRERLDKSFNVPAEMESIVTGIYDKHFSVDELKFLLSFYESPTGKKMPVLMPIIREESANSVSKYLEPLVKQVMTESASPDYKQFLKDGFISVSGLPDLNGVPEDKRQAIHQVFVACEFSKSLTAMLNFEINQLEAHLKQRNEAELAPAKNKTEQHASLSKIEHFRELFPRRVNLSDISERVFGSLLDKHFTTQELLDISAYYENPAGQKGVNLMPQAMQEALVQFRNSIEPKMITVMHEVFEELRRVSSSSEPSSGVPAGKDSRAGAGTSMGTSLKAQ